MCWVCSPQISPAWTDLSGFSRLHSLSLIDYPYAGHIVNSPMVCLPRCLRRLEITDLPNFQVRLCLKLPPCMQDADYWKRSYLLHVHLCTFAHRCTESAQQQEQAI